MTVVLEVYKKVKITPEMKRRNSKEWKTISKLLPILLENKAISENDIGVAPLEADERTFENYPIALLTGDSVLTVR